MCASTIGRKPGTHYDRDRSSGTRSFKCPSPPIKNLSLLESGAGRSVEIHGMSRWSNNQSATFFDSRNDGLPARANWATARRSNQSDRGPVRVKMKKVSARTCQNARMASLPAFRARWTSQLSSHVWRECCRLGAGTRWTTKGGFVLRRRKLKNREASSL